MKICVLGGGIAGCSTAIELAKINGVSVTLIEMRDTLLNGSSNSTPCRFSLGLHYIHPETAKFCLQNAIDVARKWPGYIVEGSDAIRHGRYFIVKEGNCFDPQEIARCWNELKKEYTRLCSNDPENQVFGAPDQFYRFLSPTEISESPISQTKVIAGIVSAESVLNWSKLRVDMIKKIHAHSNIFTALSHKVLKIQRAPDSAGYIIKTKDLIQNTDVEFRADYIINACWENIESLNQTLGMAFSSRDKTRRVKATVHVKLPSALQNHNSMFFCYGLHGSFTNCGDGTGYISYEPKTNIGFSENMALPPYLARYIYDGESIPLEEKKLFAQEVIQGLSEYIPLMKEATYIGIKYGVVKTFGKNLKNDIHQRRESGVEELDLDFINNASMKLLYFQHNAELVKSIVEKNIPLIKMRNDMRADDSRTYLDYIVNHLPHFIFWKDKDSHFLGANQQFVETVGLTSTNDIIGKTDYDMPWHNQAELFIADDKKILDTGVSKLNYEEEQLQSDGSIAVLLVSKVPIRNKKNEVIGILGIYTDITDRKKSEKELQMAKEKAENMKEKAEAANVAKSRLLAMASHELRTPLNGILGFSELLNETSLSEEQKEYLDFVRKSGEHLLAIITDILDFTRLEANKQVAKMENFNLKLLIEESIIATKHLLEENSLLSFVTEVDTHLPEMVSSDPFKIKQIIINLISNAIKFTHKGFVKINVSCKHIDTSRGLLKIFVQDTGVGISGDKFEMIFKEFEQAENGLYMRRYGGIGLGLAICRQFVELLQGKLWLESKVDEGSTFYVEIPVDRIQTDNSFKKIESQFQHEKNCVVNTRILSVEDSMIAQKMMIFMLTNLGYTPDTAGTAKEALEKLSKNPYDIVFMDIQLPDGSGDAITKLIRESNGINKNTVIIALTAHVFPNEKKVFLDAGMNKVLEKPMSKEALLEEIELVMKNE